MRSRIILFIAAVLLLQSPAAPENYQEWLNRGGKLFHEKQYEEAAECFIRALNIEPDNAIIRNSIAQCYLGKSMTFNDKDELEAKISFLRKAFEYDPSEKRIQKELYQSLAVQAEESGKNNEAVEIINDCLNIDPNDPRTLYLAGDIAFQMNDLEQCLFFWEKSAKIDPAYREALEERLYKLKKTKEIEEKFFKTRDSNFSIFFPGEADQSYVAKSIYYLRQARDKMNYTFGYMPKQKIPVIIYIGNQFQMVTESTGRVAGLYDGKIRISEHDVKQGDEALKKTIYHEYAHAALSLTISKKLPFWVQEGFAQVNEPQADLTESRKRLKQYVQSGGNIDMGLIEIYLRNKKDPETTYLGYLVSRLFFDYLIEKHGLINVKKMFRQVKKGNNLETAFKSTYFKDIKKAEKDFQEYILSY